MCIQGLRGSSGRVERHALRLVTNLGACSRVARKERQCQNGLPGFILYDHRQGRIVVPALFSQLPDCAERRSENNLFWEGEDAC